MLDHVSWSQVNMWQRCPRSWYYRYVRGLKVPPSGALIEGSCYHAALEANFRQKLESKEDLHLDSCLDAYSDAWEQRIKEEAGIVWEDSPGLLKDEGISLVEAYMRDVAPTVQPAEVEKPYVKVISGVNTVGVIDLMDIMHRLIDHKTSSRKYTQEDVDRDGQLTTYAFMKGSGSLAQVHIAVKPTKTLPARIQIVKTYRTLEDIDWWLVMMKEIISQMKTGIAPPRPTGWWCSEQFCGFYSMCKQELTRSYH